MNSFSTPDHGSHVPSARLQISSCLLPFVFVIHRSSLRHQTALQQELSALLAQLSTFTPVEHSSAVSSAATVAVSFAVCFHGLLELQLTSVQARILFYS